MKIIESLDFRGNSIKNSKKPESWGSEGRQNPGEKSKSELKVGDLGGVKIYRFEMPGQPVPLTYSSGKDTLILPGLGSHQNFYGELKRKP